jgi:hypothetical protein
MKDLCVPVPYLNEKEIAQVDVTIGGEKKKYQFRVESFPWDLDDELSGRVTEDEVTQSLLRITRLKNAINSYDPEWELLQIFTPSENARHIQVLYRKRS